jgi:uncharacterized delta-60 repeat protein
VIAGALLAGFLLLVPAAAQGRVGELDHSFGQGGRVVALSDASKSNPIRMAIGSDGSMVVAKGWVLGRFLPDGRPDMAFGEAGQLVLPEALGGLRFDFTDIAMDSLGRLLVFGTASDPSRTYEPSFIGGARSVPASWAVVLRLKANGEFDSSFGEGRGFVRDDFGLGSGLARDLPMVLGSAGEVDSQSRPLLVASVAGLVGGCYAHGGVGLLPRAVVRLTAAGSLDSTFGGGDGVRPIGGLSQDPTLAIDAADQPLVAVTAVRRTGCPMGARVVRLGPDGEPLAGFGSEGVRIYPGLGFAVMDPSGAMILRAGGRPTKRIVRVDPAGDRDQSFGQGGSATVTMPTGAKRTLSTVGVDARGRVLLAGSFALPKPQKHARRQGGRDKRQPARSFFVVTRLLANGKPDLNFGKRGWIVTPFARPSEVVARQTALDPQGRLIVAGSVSAPRQRGGGVVLARYLLGA